MTNFIATQNPVPAPAASAQALPASLRQALADPFAFADHPDAPSQMPARLPPAHDLRTGIVLLESGLRGVERKHAALCLSKLLVGFNERKTADEAKLLFEVWLEANGDVPGDLWSAGVLELLQGHKFGLPKPVHLRDAVAERLALRKLRLARARAMLARVEGRVLAAAPTHETVAERERVLRDSLLRIGKTDRAARYELALAAREGRAPADWATAERFHVKPSERP